MEEYDRFTFITFRRGKWYMVTHSSMVAKVIAFHDVFDDAYAGQHAMQHVVRETSVVRY